MKHFLSVITISLLASSSIVQATKFKVNDVLKEHDSLNIVKRVSARLDTLKQKEEKAHEKQRQHFVDERKALENLFVTKLGKNLYDESVRLSQLNTAPGEKVDIPPYFSNGTFLQLHDAIAKAKDDGEALTFKTLLGYGVALRQAITPTPQAMDEAKKEYLKVVSQRRAAKPAKEKTTVTFMLEQVAPGASYEDSKRRLRTEFNGDNDKIDLSQLSFENDDLRFGSYTLYNRRAKPNEIKVYSLTVNRDLNSIKISADDIGINFGTRTKHIGLFYKGHKFKIIIKSPRIDI